MKEAIVIDAGVGNLGNLARALSHVGAECRITTDPGTVAEARCLVLPGVGAFRPPRETLRGALEDALRRALDGGAWLLGICVGYQLLFEHGEEFGVTDGLGLLPGVIRRLPSKVPPGGKRYDVPLPHIGWNRLHDERRHPLFAGVPAGSYFYFVHSFAPLETENGACLAQATHGTPFVAVAGRGRVLGTQFHPERSGPAGLRLLANYLELAHAPDPGD